MISICCVVFVSLDVVCDERNDCSWNVDLYSSFLISVCMFIMSKAHIECCSDCSRRGSHLFEPLCYSVVYCV